MKKISLLMLLAAVGLKAQQFTYNTINHPTGDSTFVTGVSGTKVIGYYQYNGSQTSYGFIETAGSFTAIGGSIGPGINNTVVSIQPTGISGNTVVGGGLYTMGGSPELGFSYDITSDSYTIMPQGFGGASMIATGISNGLIVGYAGQILPPGNYWRKHSFTYDTNGYSAQLDYPDPLSLYEGIALSTQARGTDGTTIVGYHLISDYNPLGVNYNYRGFTLNNGTWATLNAPNAFNTYAMGINGGNIVGYFNDFDGVHGFLYDGVSYLTLDFPGATETRALGISGDVIVGSYIDALGISRGFSTAIPETPITNTINELDSRIVRGRNLLFQGGALAPNSSISINTSVIVSSNSTGLLDSSAGNIQLLGTTVINGGAQLIIQGNDISSTQVTGQLSGQGILVVMGGINTISGLNTSGGTLITGGTLQVSTNDALPSVGNVISAGKLVLVNSTSNTLTYNQAFSFEGQGASTTRTLILGTGNQTGAVRLTGQLIISADSTIDTQGQTSPGHTIDGAITTTQPSTHLRLNTSALANLTVLGSIDDNISLVKEGAGILYFGSARAYSGAMNVSAGVAIISSPSSLGFATLRADGGSFELRGGLPSSSISYSAVLELGAANSSGYAMTLGTADSQSSAVYNGAISLLTSSTRISTAAYSGSHSLQGTITASASNSALTVLVAAGSSLEVASSQIGFNGNFTKEGAGELRLNRTISGVLTVSSGTATLGATGSSGGIIISNGAELVIESTSASLRQINQIINTSGFGSTGSSIIFRPYAQGGSIELTAPITLAGDTSIKAHGNTIQLNGISGTGRTLTSDIAAGAYLKISGVSRVSRLVKNSPGSLEIFNNFNGDIELRNGTAIVNAALTGSIISQNGTTLKGSGFITGQVINSGTIAPGNSPGVLTINGSYTSTSGSYYDAEIAGSGGPGATNGHDMIAVTGVPGTFTIQANSGLRILKLNGFETGLGNSHQLISAPGGIIGNFGTINSQFNHWVLFDTASGKLHGTGLSANQNLSQILPSFGAAIWQNAITIKSNDATNGYTGTFDSTTAWGRAALTILSGGNLSGSLDASPYLVAPSALLSVIRDEHTSALSIFQNRRFERTRESQTGWAGFVQLNIISGDVPGSTNFTSSGATAGIICDISRTSSVEVAFSDHTCASTFATNYGRTRGRGFTLTAACSNMIGENDAFFLDVGISAGRDRQTTYRNTFLGTQSSSSEFSNFAAFTRLGAGIAINKSLSITPYAGLDYVRMDDFSITESGDLTALNASVTARSSSRAQLGATMDWLNTRATSQTRLSLSFELFSELANGSNSASYRYGTASSGTTSNPLGKKSGLRFTPRAEYSPDRRNQFYLVYTYENLGNFDSSSFNAGYKRSF